VRWQWHRKVATQTRWTAPQSARYLGADHVYCPRLFKSLHYPGGCLLFYKRDHVATPPGPRQFGSQRPGSPRCFYQQVKLRRRDAQSGQQRMVFVHEQTKGVNVASFDGVAGRSASSPIRSNSAS